MRIYIIYLYIHWNNTLIISATYGYRDPTYKVIYVFTKGIVIAFRNINRYEPKLQPFSSTFIEWIFISLAATQETYKCSRGKFHKSPWTSDNIVAVKVTRSCNRHQMPTIATKIGLQISVNEAKLCFPFTRSIVPINTSLV